MSESADPASSSQSGLLDSVQAQSESNVSPPADSDDSETDSDEYGTPRWLIRRLQGALQGPGQTLFDLDPTGGAEPFQIGDIRYTKEDDGLQQPWALPAVDTIYLNPPYSDPGPFLQKLKEAVDPKDPTAASLGISLTKADTSTDWFHSHLTDAQVICFLDARLSFHGAEGDAAFPNAIGVFGDPHRELLETLSDIGELYTRIEVETAVKQQCLDSLVTNSECVAAIPLSEPSQPTDGRTASTSPSQTGPSLDFVRPHDGIEMTFETSSLAIRYRDFPERVQLRVLPDGKEIDPETGTVTVDTVGKTSGGKHAYARIRSSADIASHLKICLSVGGSEWELATPQTVNIIHG